MMRALLALVLLAVLVSCADEGKVRDADNPFRMLEGQWIKEGKAASVTEAWVRTGEKRWEGQVWRIEAGDSSLLEALEIRAQGDSNYVYVATVSGQNDNRPVPFLMSQHIPDSLFVFDNVGHDFPQRISYLHPSGSDSLVITLASLQDPALDRVFIFYRISDL